MPEETPVEQAEESYGLVNRPKEVDLEEKLAGLDDHLEPADKEESKEEVQEEAEEEQEEAEEVGEQAEEAEEEAEDEGYLMDEPEEEQLPDEAKVDSAPEGLDQTAFAALTPEQQYIVSNLTPITVRGTVGGDDKVQQFTVYDPSQLPAGFRYVDDRELSAANKAFNLLEVKAQNLQNDYRNQGSKQAADEFKRREENADRSDIAKLQRSGDLPRFKADPDSADFDKDPAASFIQEILDFKDKTNERYMEEYNAGRPYKHIGFEEAFRMYNKTAPQETAQAKEDEARHKIAKRTSKTRTAPANSDQKPHVRAGMGSRDLDHLLDELTYDWE